MKRGIALEGNELDRKLNSAGQTQIREMVRALPEETLSMTWRSELNTKLRAAALRKRKLDLFGWVWKPTAGLALAAALAVAIFIRPAMTGVTPDTSIEKALVSHYIDSSAARDVAVDGMTPNEAKDSGASSVVPPDWEQEDVGATL